MTAPSREAALAVNDFVATSGRFGVAVLDAEGTVTERYGALVEQVEVGASGEDAFPFLLGFEGELEGLRGEAREHVHIPNMNLTLGDGSLVFASVFLAPGPERDTVTVVLQDTTEASKTHRQMMQQRNELDIARRELEQANDELRRRGIELDEARLRAEEATQAKSRFLAMMTHEIRTPMNGVLGMLQLIDDGTLDTEKEGYARTARGSAESLLQIIGDILDFSKIEAGRLDVERIPFSLTEVAESVAMLLRPRAEEKGIFLDRRLDKRIAPAVMGDPVRCRQILLNLIGNAIKFTAEGGVTLTIEPVAGAAPTYRFAVSDTGIGIPKEARSRLFQEFTQTDASTTRRFGGTGLGLAISKRLVELMGGEIGLISEEGEGSTFWFTLPLETTDAPVAEAEPDDLPESVPGARILLADDALANRQVGIAMLSKAGYVVDTAIDGHDAVEKVETGGYDLVLMDLSMPQMDGIQATAEIRDRGIGLPVLAMTAHPESEMEGLAGFDGHVGKPVRRAHLLRAVADALGAAGVTTGSKPADEPAARGGEPAADQEPSVLDIDVFGGFLSDVGEEAFPLLVDTYVGETRKRVDGLDEQLAANAMDVVERYAHDIKSCAGTLGANKLRDHAFELEKAVRDSLGEEVPKLVRLVIAAAAEAYPAIEAARGRVTTD